MNPKNILLTILAVGLMHQSCASTDISNPPNLPGDDTNRPQNGNNKTKPDDKKPHKPGGEDSNTGDITNPDNPKPDPKPQPKPEPKPQPQPKPDPKPQPQPKPDPKPQPQPKPDPKPQPEPKPQPDIHTKKSIRIMAANITSGGQQSYQQPGIRIFKAMKPDIVLIQEFTPGTGNIEQFVGSTFGSEFKYYRGEGNMPNGIISRYPILKSGDWASGAYNNRSMTWAIIDIPGDKDLLAVSVHLHTKKNPGEYGPLANRIAEKLQEGNYYVVLGGDFNYKGSPEIGKLKKVLNVDAPAPSDQCGVAGTNASRIKRYDWLIADSEFNKKEIPLVIDNCKPEDVLKKHVCRSAPKYTCTFHHGLVFDSRTFRPLESVSPVEADDSRASQMQHMPVIRDFVLSE